MKDELEVSERLLKLQREEYIKTHGWLWGWRKPVEPPKPQPRRLYSEEFMIPRPRIYAQVGWWIE